MKIVQDSFGYYLNAPYGYCHGNFTGDDVTDQHCIQCSYYSPGDCLKNAFYWFIGPVTESDDFAFTRFFPRMAYENIEHFPSLLFEQM